MKASWRKIKFKCAEYKPEENDILIIIEIDEIVDKLDEDL